MKLRYSRAVTWVMSLIFAISFLPESRADQNSEIESIDNSRVKLLYELTFPDCIESYELITDKDGKLRVGKVLTLKEIYCISDNNEKSLLMNRKPTGRDLQTDKLSVEEWEEEQQRRIEEAEWECGSVPNHFSRDGKYLFETISCGWECSKIRISNLTDNQSIDLPDGTYLSCVSEKSFAGFRHIYDFKGNILNSIPEGLLIKSHKKGFVAEGICFMDSKGNILNRIEHHSMGKNYDVDYETGTTAVIIPGATQNGKPGGLPAKKSNLYIYDFKGTLVAGFELPFTGYTTGIGISYGGNYVAVLSHLGWVRLFDVVNKKELWAKKFNWGGYFSDWSDPIPVSQSGLTTIVYGSLNGKRTETNSMLLFDKTGQNIGFIKPPVSKSYIGYYHISFIPDTTEVVCYSGKKLAIFKVKEEEQTHE